MSLRVRHRLALFPVGLTDRIKQMAARNAPAHPADATGVQVVRILFNGEAVASIAGVHLNTFQL